MKEYDIEMPCSAPRVKQGSHIKWFEGPCSVMWISPCSRGF